MQVLFCFVFLPKKKKKSLLAKPMTFIILGKWWYETSNGFCLTISNTNVCFVCFREKKQKIQDIKNNIKEAIEVSDSLNNFSVRLLFSI